MERPTLQRGESLKEFDRRWDAWVAAWTLDDALNFLVDQQDEGPKEVRACELVCGAIERVRELHWKATFTDVSLGIRDIEVCAVCHTVLDEPEDWPEDGPEWSYPNVQEPYPCPTLRALH